MRICILGEYFYLDNTGGLGAVLSDLVRQQEDQRDDLPSEVFTSRILFEGEAGELPRHEDRDGDK
ncbi:hypothetical protein B1R32_13211 [Abditibacterium utsteinense]|uniref:Uncharacterized protein n=1 Tax=Abditibacterium utsteinense TaxID=1960156 RepID=A0A2S8SNW0_9BACT|nr:hypothetical protein [Abditibacterium utsteinense]PQV62482.1 hypothetical protein B1R32_13211 [Abditibacterium utsteinense]